jgi:hypothetical protein
MPGPGAFKLGPKPPLGPLTVEQHSMAKARRGKGASVSGLSFPPLTRNWTVRSDPTWPGAEYTRRTRLKNKLDPSYNLSKDFTDEMAALLGDTYHHWEESMKPTVNLAVQRGRPPSESGDRPIQPAYVLRRAEVLEDGKTVDLSGTTRSLSGHVSKSRANEVSYTTFGQVPAYLFEDREKMDSLSSWFDSYGRPTPNSINLGPKQLYTHYQNSSKRCCGEPSNVQIMKKGFITQ